MRFLADRPERHGAGGEAFDDFRGRFHFLDGHGRSGGPKLQQAAQGVKVLVLLVDNSGELLECLRARLPDGMLEFADGERIPQVALAPFAVLIAASDFELGIGFRRGLQGKPVPQQGFPRQHIQAHALDAGGRAREVALHHRLVQADGFENLRAAVTLQGGDPHFGKDFQQPLVDGLDVVLQGFVRSVFRREQAFGAQVSQRFKGEIGIDGAGAIPEQQREMHHLARLARLDNEGDLIPGFLAHQVIVHGRQRQQTGNGRVLFIHSPVR